MSIGVREFLADLGVYKQIVIKTNASAAKAIANMLGLGKVRHLETNLLWIQERVASNELRVVKAPGTTNIADALSKHVEAQALEEHVRRVRAVVQTRLARDHAKPCR